MKLIFRSPWYVPLVLAVALFWVANFFYQDYRHDEAAKALALQQGMPAAVSLNAFDPARDVHPVDEVHLKAWVNTEYNSRLTLTTRHRRSSSKTVRRMFVLFGPEDTLQTKTVRAVVLVPEEDVDRFIDSVLSNVTGFGDGSAIFTLSGTASPYSQLDSMVDDNFRKSGLTKAPGFRFITVWPKGDRAAALAPSTDQLMQLPLWSALLGLFMLFVAGVKLRLSVVLAASQPRPAYHPLQSQPEIQPPVQPQTHAAIAEAAVKQREADAIAAYFAAPTRASSAAISTPLPQAAPITAAPITADAFAAFASTPGTAAAHRPQPLTKVEQADLASLRSDTDVLAQLRQQERHLIARDRWHRQFVSIPGVAAALVLSAVACDGLSTYLTLPPGDYSLGEIAQLTFQRAIP